MTNPPPTSKYMNPSEDIITAIDNMFSLYQLTHQQAVKLYHEKKSIHEGFSGFLHEHGILKQITEITEMEGKPWAPLVKAIYLLEEFTTSVDFEGAESMKDEELNYIIGVIKNGIKAKITLDTWLKDVENYTPITDVIEINFNYQFKIHKLHKIKNYTPNPKGITLYNEIYEIKNIDEMINFLRLSKQTDCLILTIMKNPEREWKSTFFMFLIYRGYLYSIDNMERRVNLNNTFGDRNPGRWIERSYKHVWLPYYLLEQKSKTEAIIVKNQIFKASTLDEVAKVDNGIIVWLELFVYRVIDEVLSKKVNRGVTPTNAVKLLPAADDKSYEYGMSERLKGKGEYLLNEYGEESTSLMVVESNDLPQVIGTRKYISEIINYKKMECLADSIQKRIINNYNKDAMTIKKWILKKANKFGIESAIVKALENHKYPITYYRRFGLTRKNKKITEELILEEGEHNWNYNSEERTDVIVFHKGVKYPKSDRRTGYYKRTCCICNCERYKVLKLEFRDHRQLIQFFNLDVNKVPRQILVHLNQKASMYVGNSILDDIDPVDLINDPWFTNHKPPVKYDDYLHDCDSKIFVVEYHVCRACYYKYLRIANSNMNREHTVKKTTIKKCRFCDWEGEVPSGKRICPSCKQKTIKKKEVE